MSLDPRAHLAALLQAALRSVAPDSGDIAVLIDRPKQASHGDFASNLALLLAKPLKANPRDLAARLVRELPPSPWLEKVDIAGAGFINFTLTAAAKTQVVGEILSAGAAYGCGQMGGGRKVQVEVFRSSSFLFRWARRMRSLP